MDGYIEADRLRTFYVKAGSGFAILLFHGAAPGSSAQVNWQLNIESLGAAGFTVYAYDQPGFGHTENPANLSIEYRVSHAKALIEALKLDRYHVIGNSVGGYIAARLAMEDHRVDKFVTTSSGTLAPKDRQIRRRWDRNTPRSYASMGRAWKICALFHGNSLSQGARDRRISARAPRDEHR